MRRLALPLLIVGAVALAAALAWFSLTRGGVARGGTEMTTEVRTVDPFNRLEIDGHAQVTLVQGDRESVTVETAERGQSRVHAQVEGRTLRIHAGMTRRWWNGLVGGRATTTPRITVTFKSLDAIGLSGAVQLAADRIRGSDLRIAASGGSTVRIDDIEAKTLRVEGSGALKATLGGEVVEQRISISGAGEVRGEKLASQSAIVDVSGAGSIVVNVARTLRATISGAGSVEYYGDPEVKQSVSGIGRVKRRSSAALAGPSIAADTNYWMRTVDIVSAVSPLKNSLIPVAASRSA